MAGKNRKGRKKKSTPPIPTPNAEPTSPPLATTATSKRETPQAHIDDVLRAETITKSVGLILELQQQKIESLVRLNNGNQSLSGEVVKLIKEHAEWKDEKEHWKQEIEHWKKENIIIKTSMVWAQASGCTHLDDRILEGLNDLRWDLFESNENELLQVMKKMDQNYDDPVQREAMKDKYFEDNKVAVQTLERMGNIAAAIAKKQQAGNGVEQSSE